MPRWNRTCALTLIGSTVGFLTGCGEEDVDSENIRTAGMYAIFSALATGNGDTVVTAQLRVGGDDGTIVNLSSGDQLVGIVGTEERRLGAIQDRERYRSSFGTDEGGTEVVIAFERDWDEPAPDSSVALPEPFSLALGEDMDDSIQRGGDVKIVWEPAASGSVAWSVDGECVWMDHGTTDDDGSLVLDAEDVSVQSLDEGETCQVTVTVERTARGNVDPAFEEGGVFEATQRRRVTFTSTPGPDEEGYEPSGTGGSSSGSGGSPSTDGGAGGAEPAAAGGAGGRPGSEVGGSAGST